MPRSFHGEGEQPGRRGDLADEFALLEVAAHLDRHLAASEHHRRIDQLDARRRDGDDVLRGARAAGDLARLFLLFCLERGETLPGLPRLGFDARDLALLAREFLLAQLELGFEAAQVLVRPGVALGARAGKLGLEAVDAPLVLVGALTAHREFVFVCLQALARPIELLAQRGGFALQRLQLLARRTERGVERAHLADARVEFGVALAQRLLQLSHGRAVAAGLRVAYAPFEQAALGAGILAQAVEFLLRLVELLPRGVEFDLQRAHLLVARGIAAFEGDGTFQPGGLAVEVDRLRRAALDAEALLVEEAKVDQRARIALVGGLAIPACRLAEVGRHAADAALVDLADVGLRGSIPLLCGRHPGGEHVVETGTVVQHVLAAAQAAFVGAEFGGAACREISHVGAELAHLARQHAVDDQELVGVAARLLRRCRQAGQLATQTKEACNA